jgi:hypothetical protein
MAGVWSHGVTSESDGACWALAGMIPALMAAGGGGELHDVGSSST